MKTPAREIVVKLYHVSLIVIFMRFPLPSCYLILNSLCPLTKNIFSFESLQGQEDREQANAQNVVFADEAKVNTDVGREGVDVESVPHPSSGDMEANHEQGYNRNKTFVHH